MINRSRLLKFGISALVALNIFAINHFSTFAQDNTTVYKPVNSLELVNTPDQYLNQKVKMTATFDRFSNLGLDYKPALKDSKKYISFLIRRQDVADHDIPLSELKLMLLKDKAEKLTDLESGDKIELTGMVFSNALNDPWIEVDNVKILTQKTKKEEKKELTNKTTQKPLTKPVIPNKK